MLKIQPVGHVKG